MKLQRNGGRTLKHILYLNDEEQSMMDELVRKYPGNRVSGLLRGLLIAEYERQHAKLNITITKVEDDI